MIQAKLKRKLFGPNFKIMQESRNKSNNSNAIKRHDFKLLDISMINSVRNRFYFNCNF